MAKDKKLTCVVCGAEISGEYMQSKVDGELKDTENGACVCSEKCAREYEKGLPYGGRPIQHWSRITGYYQNVDSWNDGKLQELRDRKRYGV